MRKMIAFAVSLSLAGCATGAINRPGRLPTEAAAAAKGPDGTPLRQRQIDLAAILRSELRQAGVTISSDQAPSGAVDDNTLYIGSGPTSLDLLIAATDRAGANSRAVRNDVITSWMSASTANCAVYVQSLRGGQVGSRLVTDFLAGGFAAASSLATPEGSARILAALSAFSTAEGASIDRNVFAQQGAELVADAILQLRAESRARLEAKLTTNYIDYPMGLALVDLHEFHNDCSMLRGLARMREAILAREQTVQTIRSAAAAVQRAGGSPQEIVAVIGALQDGTTPAAAPAVSRARADGGDLAGLHAAAAGCLDELKGILRSESSKTTDAALTDVAQTNPACAAQAGWAGRYKRLLTTRQGDRAAAATAIDGAQTRITAAAALHAAADEASKQAALEGLNAAKAERDAAIQSLVEAFEEVASGYDTANLNARNLALDLLEGWDAARGLDEVAAALKAIGGPELVSVTAGQGDPVFMLAIAAAEQLKQQRPDAGSDAAARQALSAARAYMGVS